jgi:hypothetical protein
MVRTVSADKVAVAASNDVNPSSVVRAVFNAFSDQIVV